MRLPVDEIVKNIKYTRSSFLKVLTRNGISNHFELSKDDLLKLYHNEGVKNQHSKSLRNYLISVIPVDNKVYYV